VLIQARTRHSTSAEVTARLDAEQPFTPGDAAAVASWYQSPAGLGAVFASFASGLPVHRPAMLDAITSELTLGNSDPQSGPELRALAAWARAQ